MKRIKSRKTLNHWNHWLPLNENKETNKENDDPLTYADIVKKGPTDQGLSPLVMGGAGIESAEV